MTGKQTLIAAVAASFVAFSANASTTDPIAQLIHFDELTSNAILEQYITEDKNFVVDAIDVTEVKPKTTPATYTYSDGKVNPQSGNCAPSTDSNPSNCIIESSQGQIFTLKHDSGASGVLANYGAQAEDTFDFLGFYFELTGNGGSCSGITGGSASCTNFLTISAYSIGADPTSDSALGSLTWFAGLTDNNQYLSYAPSGGNVGASEPVGFSNQGYYVNLQSFSLWENVGLITFQSGSYAQIRLDCISVASDNSTTSPYNTDTACGLGTTTVVPLPAAGWLMLAGIGGLVALRRKKDV
jgi:hypothetical protein